MFYKKKNTVTVNLPTCTAAVGTCFCFLSLYWISQQQQKCLTIRHRRAGWHIKRKRWELLGEKGSRHPKTAFGDKLCLNDLGKMKILQFFTFMINAANPVTVLWSLQLLLRVWKLSSKRRLSCHPESHLKVCLCWRCLPALLTVTVDKMVSETLMGHI